MNLMLLGIYPWNYQELSDTVRSMTVFLNGVAPIYLNPRSERRSFALSWQEHAEENLRIWDPPFGWLPTRYGMHRLRGKLTARALKRDAVRKLGAGWRDNTVVYVTASTLEQSYEYVKHLQPKRLVFDILDDNLGFPGITPERRRKLKHMFLEIAGRAELITAVSQYLVNQTAEWTGKKVEYLPNGVDVERFRRDSVQGRTDASEPADIRGIPHPRAVFVGALTGWIDLRLLEKAARHFLECGPAVQLLLVGPEFESADSASLGKLKKLPNVHLLGPKRFDEIPRYMHAADVLLLPRTYDPYSLACDPLKLYEYLATGKPIASTWHPSVERFAGTVYVGRDDESFITAIKDALNRGPEGEASQAALVDGLSWEARAGRLVRLLKKEDPISVPATISLCRRRPEHS